MFSLHFLHTNLHPATVKDKGVEVTLYKANSALVFTMLGGQKLQNNHTVTIIFFLLKTIMHCEDPCPITGVHVFADCNRSRPNLLKNGLSKHKSDV